MNDVYSNGIMDSLGAEDGFAVFGTEKGVEKCLGYTLIGSVVDTLNLTIRAEVLYEVTNLKFKRWTVAASCVHTTRFQDSTIAIVNNSYGAVKELRFNDFAQIEYPKDTLYTNETSLLPIMGEINEATSFYGTNGLTIHQGTGDINAKMTGAGEYIVTVNTLMCYKGSDISIVILDTVDTRPKLDSALVRFKLIAPTCEAKGSIVFEGTGAPVGTQFVLQDVDTGSKLTSSTGNFTSIKDGVYQIQLSYNGISFNYKETFVLSTSKACSNPVLNFSNTSGVPASIYLEKPGIVQIFNRDGKLVKTMQAPAEWTGTDQSGNDVPMGDYYLYLNDNKEQTITILR